MSSRRTYVTTTIPYVNAPPHVGFAMELVQADALARHRRGRGDAVRLLTGTDDNSLSNVLAAEAEGVPIAELVDRNAAHFVALSAPLQTAPNDFIRTSRDPRHRPAVERLWRACDVAGDLYRRDYAGLYCARCERFLAPDELADGRCPDHLVAPEPVAEENWFFRLSRYQQAVHELVRSRRLRILPETQERAALAFIEAGLQDFSVSRSRKRARSWGIPVPGDPGQVVYVWFDALVNYVSAVQYGTGGDLYRTWWLEADERVHVVGKNVLRFHAVYWPAMLLAAGEPPPTTILVHEFLTVAGKKIGKSLGNAIDPRDLVQRYGGDALRWWLLREPSPVADTDFTVERLVARADQDLANGIGNLVSRTAAMVHRYRGGRVPNAPAVGSGTGGLAREVATAVDRYDFRAATAALVAAADAANRLVNQARPWDLAAAERAGDQAAGRALDRVLATLLDACRQLASELAPFVPALAGRIERQLAGSPLPAPEPVFRRVGGAHAAQ